MSFIFKNKELRFLLVRHGITTWNSQLRFLGQKDIPMNAHGTKQVLALAKRLTSETIDIIYTSDLQRASETARIINQFHKCEIIYSSELREMDFGDWTGKTYRRIKKIDYEKTLVWEKDRINMVIPGGESLKQLSERIMRMLEFCLKTHLNETILVTSHSGTLQVLICLALDIPIQQYWRFVLSPASLSELRIYDGSALINVINDTCHLEYDIEQTE